MDTLASLWKNVLPGSRRDRAIRPPAVAGMFYPAEARTLAAMVDQFLAKAEAAQTPAIEDPVALVAPHAGYIYSGPVAAYSYAQLKGRKYDRVVVIAPSHHQAFEFSSVYDGAAYQTPIGEIPVDGAFARQIAGESPVIRLSTAGHSTSGPRPEHALEVQLPFLQRVLGSFQLVPVIVGDSGYDVCRALGVAIGNAAAGSQTLIVASSDLSHYHSSGDAVAVDRKTLGGIAEYDYFDLSRNLDRGICEACGGGPVVAAMIAAERLGATEARVLHYANSGDTTGDRTRVVGYGAVAFVRADDAAEPLFSLAAAEKDALLEIARRSVESAIRYRQPFDSSSAVPDGLMRERGAFVTITRHGQLRGCIGSASARKPLYLTIRDMAMAAALRDSRFRPVTGSELAELDYEISVLSPLRRVQDIGEIRVGRHGLLIHKSTGEGLLLPQVATQARWNVATFLQQVCRKAGLSLEAWKDADADLFRFTALVFGNHAPAWRSFAAG